MLTPLHGGALHGIENGLELEDALAGNAYEDANAPRIPGTLREALALWESGPAARELHLVRPDHRAAQGLGRTSYDDAGAVVSITVHYGRDYDNAFWDGTQLVFGDGDGRVFERFTKPVDVLAHEFSHAVIEHTADLTYRGQSGALNEAGGVSVTVGGRRLYAAVQCAEKVPNIVTITATGPGGHAATGVPPSRRTNSSRCVNRSIEPYGDHRGSVA